jgi:hypothetical protein
MEYIKNIGPKIDIELYSLEFDTKQIAKEILSQPLNKWSEDPCNTSFEDYIFNPLPNSESLKLVEHLKNFAFSKNHIIEDIWSHVHQPLESTNTHDHGRLGFSFVYYVQVPKNSGKFAVDFRLGGRYILPIFKEGDLLLFPSWVPHLVTKNLSNDIRISISGNFKEIK